MGAIGKNLLSLGSEVSAEAPAETRSYVGLTKNEVKDRIFQHNSDVTNLKKQSSTALTTYLRKLVSDGRDYKTEWSVLCQSDTIRPGGRSCNLCLSEKIAILKSNKKHSLNVKSEIFGKCRHLRDTLLSSLI